MEELVIQNSKGNDVTTSLIVADVFGKRNSDVLRDVRNLNCSESFRERNFALMVIMKQLPQGGSQKTEYYEMTKDGFSFLVMGYTGAKAGEFKEKFINEFNKREALLKNDDYILMRSQQILNKRIEAQEEKIRQLESQNEQQQATIEIQTEEMKKAAPKVEYYDKVLSSQGYLTVNMIASCLGISDIKLNKLLCQWGVQYKESGTYQLYSKYRDKGYTVHKPHAYTDSNGNIRTRQHMYWKEEGKKFIIDLYNSKIAS